MNLPAHGRSQLGVMLAAAGIGFGDLAHQLAWTIDCLFALGFAGATLGLGIDG